jgi:hypothetical protein
VGPVTATTEQEGGCDVFTAYNLALFIHILGVITLFAALALVQRGGARLRQARTVEHARLWLSLLQPTGRMFPSAAVMLFLSGLFMADQVWSFTTPWVVVGFVTLAAMMIVGSTVTGRGLARAGRMSASSDEGPLPEELRGLISAPAQWVSASGLSGAGIGVVWLMTTKPDWTVSIVVVVALSAIGAVVGNLVVRRRA